MATPIVVSADHRKKHAALPMDIALSYNSRLYREFSPPNLQRIYGKTLLWVVMPPAIVAASPGEIALLHCRRIGKAVAPSFGEGSLVIAIPSVESTAPEGLSATDHMRREIGNITIVATLAGNGSNGRGGWARMPWGWKNAVRPSRPRFARHLRMRYVS